MLRRMAAVVALLATTGLSTPAVADLYQWTDADGVRHYTSDLDNVPEVYREGARNIGSPRVREAPAAEPRREADRGVMLFRSGAPVIAPVLLNGVGLRLMIDTGADRTMISPAALARTGLGLDGGRPVRIIGVAGSAMASELTVTHMEVAGARVGPLRVIVHETPSESLDGLLGRDVLDSFTLTVDSNAGRATLTPR
jgi:hypothetical protein